MPTHRIIGGPTRDEQLEKYKAGDSSLIIILEDRKEVAVHVLTLEIGHKFRGLVKHKELTDGHSFRCTGTYDPYGKTGEIKILGPQFTP